MKNRNGKLLGINLSHEDDFTIAENEEFVRRIVKGILDWFTVSKIEKDQFKFTELDIKTKKLRDKQFR